MLDVRARPLEAEGTPSAWVVVVADVTAARRQQDELGRFAGHAAHELRGPLAVAAGWGQALDGLLAEADGLPDAATARRMLARLRSGVGDMDRLVDDLLGHARTGDAALAPVTLGLEELVLAATEQVGGGAAVEVVPGPAVRADRLLAERLVTNLVGNAVKHAGAHGRPRVRVASRAAGPWVEVRVEDDGPGIEESAREQVFSQFERGRTDAPGHGLGLAIARAAVERHGGRIWVEASELGGACLAFTLPAAPLGDGVVEGVAAGSA